MSRGKINLLTLCVLLFIVFNGHYLLLNTMGMGLWVLAAIQAGVFFFLLRGVRIARWAFTLFYGVFGLMILIHYLISDRYYVRDFESALASGVMVFSACYIQLARSVSAFFKEK